MKKFFCIAFLLIATGLASLFAYDGTVYGGLDGVFSRDNYVEQAGDPDVAIAVVESIGAGELTDFYQITSEIADDDDIDVAENIIDYIKDNFKVKNNQAYSFVVVDSQTDEELDGWVIFYHYSKKAEDPELLYMYYFTLVF